MYTHSTVQFFLYVCVGVWLRVWVWCSIIDRVNETNRCIALLFTQSSNSIYLYWGLCVHACLCVQPKTLKSMPIYYTLSTALHLRHSYVCVVAVIGRISVVCIATKIYSSCISNLSCAWAIRKKCCLTNSPPYLWKFVVVIVLQCKFDIQSN